MAVRHDETLSLAIAGKMLGYSDRTVAALIRQGKLEEAAAPASRERGRPPTFVKRSSVIEYARVNYRILRDVGADEVRGRNDALSGWLKKQSRLMGRVKAARIIEIDGQGAGGKVWVRFFIAGTKRRRTLTFFWRQDAGAIFGARKFRIEFGGQEETSVYVRSQDEEDDRLELTRCVSAAIAAVEREELRIERGRENKS